MGGDKRIESKKKEIYDIWGKGIIAMRMKSVCRVETCS